MEGKAALENVPFWCWAEWDFAVSELLHGATCTALYHLFCHLCGLFNIAELLCYQPVQTQTDGEEQNILKTHTYVTTMYNEI